jgi:hypothetical protein
VGPRADLDAERREQSLSLVGNRTPTVQSVARLSTELCPLLSKRRIAPKCPNNLLLECRNYSELLITGGGIVSTALRQNSCGKKEAKDQNPGETFLMRSGLLAWAP